MIVCLGGWVGQLTEVALLPGVKALKLIHLGRSKGPLDLLVTSKRFSCFVASFSGSQVLPETCSGAHRKKPREVTYGYVQSLTAAEGDEELNHDSQLQGAMLELTIPSFSCLVNSTANRPECVFCEKQCL